MEQGFRYEKDCLSKKERTTCIGNAVVGHPVDGNSGENPKRFNVKGDKISTKSYFAPRLLLNITAPRPRSKSVAGSGTTVTVIVSIDV